MNNRIMYFILFALFGVTIAMYTIYETDILDSDISSSPTDGKQNVNTKNNSDNKRKILIENNKKYFSGWDGSNPEFVDYIKQLMNDPDSFHHVETRYNDKGDSLEIYMKYRGKNAFNGTVTEEAVCIFDKNTKTISNVEFINH